MLFAVEMMEIEMVNILNQIGEMGDLGASLARFLIWSSDLPMRASFSFANLAFALLCCGV